MIVTNAQTALFPDCQSGPLKSFPICDQSLSVQQRAIDLVSRMTIEEKADWLINTVQPIPRLGLPSYQWWNEALHGVMYLKAHAIGVPEATSFPSPLNLASTFNLNLIHRIANIISTEARAANNENITGLNFFTPNINLVRDPRWGRGQETPGEDPFLASQYVSALVRGLQEGEDSRYLKIAATCKHFIAYDMDAWNGTSRWSFDAQHAFVMHMLLDMRMRPSDISPGRTYKFYTGQPVFEFGYGLSYTTFSYHWYNDSNTIFYSIESLFYNKYDVLIELFRVNVTNTGSMNGDDIVLAYIKPPQILDDGETPPIKQLFGFERINLNVGETKQVFFPLNIETLFRIDRYGSKWIHPGEYDILIGNQHMFTIKLNGYSTLWIPFK
ncbi:unnamed protein product [Rotaria sordida]|uniref:Fibronectin type III-like domain-containing protein n=1 Tax=Rotaria sordida TaxID=392033 RepID=A0A815IBD8_9BILA|nr:unnamed protein product [Rotaria sordida]